MQIEEQYFYRMKIDIEFDFNSDSGGLDPDRHSPTLKSYHQILWSKDLPSGKRIVLTDGGVRGYLKYEDSEKIIELSSDNIANSYANSESKVIKPTIDLINSELVESFRSLNSTIGGYIIFPAKKIDNKQTINGARGFSRTIADRFDLTLECIRHYYLNEFNPLSGVLERYEEFFSLFGDFQGYVDFFLLNDLINSDYSVRFFLPRTEIFPKVGYPQNVEEYRIYRENTMEFVANRNQRIHNLFG